MSALGWSSASLAEFDYHPVSNLTPTHTGHAFGSEGYKTIAYELYQELGVPAGVVVRADR